MLKYKIIQANSSESLEAGVVGLINDGWKLHGGIAVVDMAGTVSPSGHNVLTYCQAMIKEE